MPEAITAGGGGSELITQIVGLFNIFVGLMLVAALLAYGGGFIVWVTRLGSWPSPRDTAIEIISWAPRTLFVLIALLAIVQYLQRHPQAGAYILATIVILVVAGVILYLVFTAAKGEKKEEEH